MPATPSTSLAPCGTATVYNGDDLLNALAQLQTSHARVFITLAANASLPASPTPQREESSLDDAAPLIELYRNITLAGGVRPLAAGGTELDVRQRRNAFDLLVGAARRGLPQPVLVMADLQVRDEDGALSSVSRLSFMLSYNTSTSISSRVATHEYDMWTDLAPAGVAAGGGSGPPDLPLLPPSSFLAVASAAQLLQVLKTGVLLSHPVLLVGPAAGASVWLDAVNLPLLAGTANGSSSSSGSSSNSGSSNMGSITLMRLRAGGILAAPGWLQRQQPGALDSTRAALTSVLGLLLTFNSPEYQLMLCTVAATAAGPAAGAPATDGRTFASGSASSSRAAANASSLWQQVLCGLAGAGNATGGGALTTAAGFPAQLMSALAILLQGEMKAAGKSSTAAIIGGVVGGAVGLILLLGSVLAALVMWRRRKQHRLQQQDSTRGKGVTQDPTTATSVPLQHKRAAGDPRGCCLPRLGLKTVAVAAAATAPAAYTANSSSKQQRQCQQAQAAARPHQPPQVVIAVGSGNNGDDGTATAAATDAQPRPGTRTTTTTAAVDAATAASYGGHVVNGGAAAGGAAAVHGGGAAAAASRAPPQAADSLDFTLDSAGSKPPTQQATMFDMVMQRPAAAGGGERVAPSPEGGAAEPAAAAQPAAFTDAAKPPRDHRPQGPPSTADACANMENRIQQLKTVMQLVADSRRLERLASEVAIACSLSHPCLVTTYNYSLEQLPYGAQQGVHMAAADSNGWPAALPPPPLDPLGGHRDDADAALAVRLRLVMEFCEGGTLKDALLQGLFASEPPQNSLLSAASSIAVARGSVRAAAATDNYTGGGGDGGAGGDGDGGGGAISARQQRQQQYARLRHLVLPAATKESAGGAGVSPRQQTMAAAATAASRHSSSRRSSLEEKRPRVRNLPLALVAARDVLSGLSYLHACSVIHGDLNENNILLKRASPVLPVSAAAAVASVAAAEATAEAAALNTAAALALSTAGGSVTASALVALVGSGASDVAKPGLMRPDERMALWGRGSGSSRYSRPTAMRAAPDAPLSHPSPPLAAAVAHHHQRVSPGKPESALLTGAAWVGVEAGSLPAAAAAADVADVAAATAASAAGDGGGQPFPGVSQAAAGWRQPPPPPPPPLQLLQQPQDAALATLLADGRTPEQHGRSSIRAGYAAGAAAAAAAAAAGETADTTIPVIPAAAGAIQQTAVPDGSGGGGSSHAAYRTAAAVGGLGATATSSAILETSTPFTGSSSAASSSVSFMNALMAGHPQTRRMASGLPAAAAPVVPFSGGAAAAAAGLLLRPAAAAPRAPLQQAPGGDVGAEPPQAHQTAAGKGGGLLLAAAADSSSAHWSTSSDSTRSRGGYCHVGGRKQQHQLQAQEHGLQDQQLQQLQPLVSVDGEAHAGGATNKAAAPAVAPEGAHLLSTAASLQLQQLLWQARAAPEGSSYSSGVLSGGGRVGSSSAAMARTPAAAQTSTVVMAAAAELMRHVFKISDFGLSMHMQAENQTHISNAYQGTPFFTAPEVIMHGRLSPAADMYSFGVVLWLLLHGVSLRGAGVAVTLYRVSPIGPELLRRTSPDLPPAATQLLAECLDLDPGRRPTAVDAVQRITALLEEALGPALGAVLLSIERAMPHGQQH
ncbi:hypothetical protein HXX76_015198 [Chlamydomonas incerta]|uniref:Protein kinase domain-containing protein n=1 Tax=Chlamydomonas incerta TaxID=51695 RepID=A0A835SF10_CHLIN|nr:hypothetical protein HXX76_015198 [Chlamydomonas incerta]|eukprot:KAG2423557.1 hypothetical protein HXX76_015198 [Chlamydomonas incerta]